MKKPEERQIKPSARPEKRAPRKADAGTPRR